MFNEIEPNLDLFMQKILFDFIQAFKTFEVETKDASTLYFKIYDTNKIVIQAQLDATIKLLNLMSAICTTRSNRNKSNLRIFF